MMADGSTETWQEYTTRNRMRCDAQATTLQKRLSKLANDTDRSFRVDFMFFDDSKENLQSPMEILSNDYNVEIVEYEDGGWWALQCHKLPLSIQTIIEHYSKAWVNEMCILSEKTGCTFSTWRFTDLDTLEHWGNSCAVANNA